MVSLLAQHSTMKLLFLCAATALAANSAIDTMKPEAVFRPYGNHRGDLSDVIDADGKSTGRGAGFADRLASSNKLECDAGKYIAFTLSGLKACFQCPAGKFQSKAGQTTCTDCDAGKYSEHTEREHDFQPHGNLKWYARSS